MLATSWDLRELLVDLATPKPTVCRLRTNIVTKLAATARNLSPNLHFVYRILPRHYSHQYSAPESTSLNSISMDIAPTNCHDCLKPHCCEELLVDRCEARASRRSRTFPSSRSYENSDRVREQEADLTIQTERYTGTDRSYQSNAWCRLTSRTLSVYAWYLCYNASCWH